VTIDTETQVSISHRSDITTGGGTNSHRSDIATENTRLLYGRGAIVWGLYNEGRRSACSNQKVRVRIGLDTGFMALDLILYTREYYGHACTYFEIMTHLNV